MTTPKRFATTPFALAEATRLLGREVVAGILGCSPNQIYKGCNPNAPNGLAFLQWDKVKLLVALLRARGHAEFFTLALDTEADYLADDLRARADGSLERLAMCAAAEGGDVQRVLADITADESEGGSDVTAAEAQRALAQVDEAIAALRAVRQRVVAEAALAGRGRR